ncbi:hypothetical protein [Paraburkholderia agricolaris]|uniref:hypothetical protein n=1 Tax=Paraburkholderia agricolaris TaxID=2152888 RepID=UPI00142F1D17|nr:hypothetical protein [Paraburkholderia agricolaris]
MLHSVLIASARASAKAESTIKSFDEMRTELTDFIRTQPRAFLNAIRNAHDSLLNSLAEVKGYIVYALKSIVDRFDEWRLEATDAISRILAAAQIRNELENVYPFTSSEIAVKGNAQVARNEIGQVVGTASWRWWKAVCVSIRRRVSALSSTIRPRTRCNKEPRPPGWIQKRPRATAPRWLERRHRFNREYRSGAVWVIGLVWLKRNHGCCWLLEYRCCCRAAFLHRKST